MVLLSPAPSSSRLYSLLGGSESTWSETRTSRAGSRPWLVTRTANRNGCLAGDIPLSRRSSSMPRLCTSCSLMKTKWVRMSPLTFFQGVFDFPELLPAGGLAVGKDINFLPDGEPALECFDGLVDGRPQIGAAVREGASLMALRARLKSNVGSGTTPLTMSEASRMATDEPAGIVSMACSAVFFAFSKRVWVPSLMPMLRSCQGRRRP